MKTRLLPVAFLVSFLLPVQLLRAASDVTVSTAATSGGSFSGGNPNVFTPTVNSAVANNATIQTSLNAGTGMTINTASAAAGNGDLTIINTLAKTAGASSTLTLNAVRDLAINAAISASGSPLPLVFNAGGTISSSASIASNGGDITINTAQPFTLGSSLDADAGQVLLQTGGIQSAGYQTITAGSVVVSAPAALRLYGNVAGDLSVAGTISAGDGTTSLSVTGSLTLQPTSTTSVKLGGTSQGGNFGSLSASGAVTAAGVLDVTFVNGFEDQITSGSIFTILSGASVTGTFTGLPDNARITFPNDHGTLKITCTATAVTLSDWQPVIHELTWDPGTADTGTQIFSNTNTRAGRHYFHINTQATDIGAWKTRLTVTGGDADLYISQTAVPQTTSGVAANRKSERIGSDGLVLRTDEYSAGEDWYLLVNATAGAQWAIFTGRAWVQDLGALGWTDTNNNGAYDIGETALPTGSGNVSLGPEGMRFFKTTVPTGTPAWSLWLHGDPRDVAVRKNFVPFHASTSYYDRKQSGRMLVVAPYLSGLSSTYFLSVIGEPGDVVNLDSHIQEVTDVGFNTTQSNVAVPATPYRVYRVQVPVQQIAWDVAVTPVTGDANVCVRRDNPPAEFDNDAFSEVAGPSTDSITLVPDFLTDATWFITVYGSSPYTFTLRNGPPTITPLNYTDTKLNDQTTRAGWRFYALSGPNSIADQLGSLGWELNLANQVPGTEIAIRRNAVPSRWRSRINGSENIGIGSRVDASGTGGFLQHPGHQADIWYVGIFMPTAALSAFTLTTAPIVPTTETFNGGAHSFSNQEPGRLKFMRIDVPAGVIGWDVRLRDVSGGTPQMVVRRDQLPDAVATNFSPERSSVWPSGFQWTSYLDWTQRYYQAGESSNYLNRHMAMGMGRPLEPGTYYIGVYNAHATEASSYTFASRGIGAGQTLPTPALAFAGGAATVSNLAVREAAYFKVTILPNTPSWEITLDPTQGEMMLAVRRGTVPDCELFDSNASYGYLFPQYETPQYDDGDREVPLQKAGAERYVLLPRDGQDYLIAGDYYLAVIGEGQNPADSSHTGTGTSSGVLTSQGVLAVTALGAASLAGITQAVALESGQIKTYEFTVPAGTASLEVRLDNRVGNPWLSLVPGMRSPTANYEPYSSGRPGIYGFGDGQSSAVSGVNWQADDDLLTVANPPPGTYRVTVRANYVGADFPNATASLVVIQKPNILLNFAASLDGNGYSHTDSRQLIDGEYIIYQVTVPMTESGQPVVGWIIQTDVLQGAVSLQVYKNFADPASGATVAGGFAVIVPPFLTPGDTWYVRVKTTGLTNYTITSRPVNVEPHPFNPGGPIVWPMPTFHNVTFGDSGNNASGNPLPGDRGIDLAQGEWHFYAIDVPNGNSGLLRTELQNISGNSDLYIREDGVPTTSHTSSPPYWGTVLYQRTLTDPSVTEYGNWVPLDGQTQRQLTPGRWYLGVKAAGNSNARYRLIVSTGQVADLALNGGSLTNQLLPDNDWRYYRLTVPADAPNNWALTFSQQVGDVVMWLRDSVPPGQGNANYNYSNYLESWYSDNKNQGPYNLNGHDAVGTYTFTTPPLRPGHTYYAGFRSNNSATFSISSATSGGTIGVLPSLDFYTGTVTTSIPASSSVLYQIPVPPVATRFKYSSTHASSVTVRMEQGTLPGTAGTQHLISSGADSSLNQPLSTAVWPWQPNQTYYVRFVNTTATARAITFTLNGKNALTEDEDNDGLPDAWELQYFGTTAYGPTQDNDEDGANNLEEWAFNMNPTRPDIAALTPGTGTAGLPVARLTGSAGNQRLTIEFVRRKNAALTYTVQFANSPAGAGFLSAVNAPIVTPIDTNWVRVIVEDSVTTGDQAIRFGRVRVTAP